MSPSSTDLDRTGCCTLVPPFLRIPRELVDEIFEKLSRRDWKSLRQTCRFFDASTTRPLFRRIYLSKTKLDHDTFFNIARTPHLASLVEQLVWYELLEDETTFCQLEEDLADVKLPSNLRDEGDNQPLELPPFFQLAQDAFWWPTTKSSNTFRDAHPMEAMEKAESWRPDIVDDFMSRFLLALDSMPNIHTFVACPMPSQRIVADKGYKLTAELLYQGTYGDVSTERWDDGFGTFLLRALSVRQGQFAVRRLVYKDLGRSSLTYSSVDLPFAELTHIELCLGSQSLVEYTNCIPSCLRSAASLEDLRICLGEAKDPGRRQNQFLQVLGIGSRDIYYWPCLRRLELSNVDMRRKHMQRVFDILKLHTQTLSHVVFRHCDVPGTFLKYMRCIYDLELSYLKIEEYADKQTAIVDQQELLAYVNRVIRWPEALVGLEKSVVCTSSSLDTRGGDRHEAARFNPRPADCVSLNNNHGSWYSDYDVFAIRLIMRPEESLDPNASQPAVHSSGGYVRIALKGGTGNPHLENVMEELNIPRKAWLNHWLFVHPDGRQAIGCDPLQYFSDWEETDEESDDETDDEEEDADSQADFAYGDGYEDE